MEGPFFAIVDKMIFKRKVNNNNNLRLFSGFWDPEFSPTQESREN